jgi:hypothetical protein
MANYLTQTDVDNYGSDLLDVSQRAAMNALAPHLQHLQQQNHDLHARLAREQRHRLDQQVAQLVPNYLAVDSDPAWHRWLLGVDAMTGRVRQALLDQAIRDGSANRVAAFFRQFAQSNQSGTSPSGAAPRRARQATEKPVYTRDLIAKLYDQHRRGAYAGREDEWNRIERDLFEAQTQGRIQMHPYVSK